MMLEKTDFLLEEFAILSKFACFGMSESAFIIFTESLLTGFMKMLKMAFFFELTISHIVIVTLEETSILFCELYFCFDHHSQYFCLGIYIKLRESLVMANFHTFGTNIYFCIKVYNQ